MFMLGAESQRRLQGVHPDLRQVVEHAIGLSTIDFSVLEGLRSLARQEQLYAQGRTTPGKIVTWTMKSKHLLGEAVDLVPFPLDWSDTNKFDAISRAMFAAAKEVGVAIRWGADWDGDGTPREKGEMDSPHFELA